jgi:hypothetical protein
MIRVACEVRLTGKSLVDEVICDASSTSSAGSLSSAAELWAKYSGAPSYDQEHHRDYLNHT